MSDAGASDFSAIDAMAGGDPQLARHLRASMAVVARRTEDPELHQLVVSVLAGKQSVRRVFEHPSFREMAATNIGNLEKGLAGSPTRSGRA